MSTLLSNLSVQQLRQAANLKERIEALQKQLVQLGGTVSTPSAQSQKTGKRGMSAAGKARIAAAQKARWAKLKHPKGPSTMTAKPASAAKTTKKSGMSAAAKAKLSAKMKALWAARRAAKSK